jgi:hypothetical protein
LKRDAREWLKNTIPVGRQADQGWWRTRAGQLQALSFDHRASRPALGCGELSQPEHAALTTYLNRLLFAVYDCAPKKGDGMDTWGELEREAHRVVLNLLDASEAIDPPAVARFVLRKNAQTAGDESVAALAKTIQRYADELKEPTDVG